MVGVMMMAKLFDSLVFQAGTISRLATTTAAKQWSGNAAVPLPVVLLP
jgi:hypothetical protein